MKFPEHFRVKEAGQYSSKEGYDCGAFEVPARAAKGRSLTVIASAGIPLEVAWDHVSVTVTGNRLVSPTWDEMCVVKNLFWDKEEWVVQFHPAASDYVNNHRGCLHLWRPHGHFPLPPVICV